MLGLPLVYGGDSVSPVLARDVEALANKHPYFVFHVSCKQRSVLSVVILLVLDSIRSVWFRIEPERLGWHLTILQLTAWYSVVLLLDMPGEVLPIHVPTLVAHPLFGTILVLPLPTNSGSFCYSMGDFGVIHRCFRK